MRFDSGFNRSSNYLIIVHRYRREGFGYVSTRNGASQGT